MPQLDAELAEINAEISSLEQSLASVKDAAMADGVIDDDEQRAIDDLKDAIGFTKRERDAIQEDIKADAEAQSDDGEDESLWDKVSGAASDFFDGDEDDKDDNTEQQAQSDIDTVVASSNDEEDQKMANVEEGGGGQDTNDEGAEDDDVIIIDDDETDVEKLTEAKDKLFDMFDKTMEALPDPMQDFLDEFGDTAGDFTDNLTENLLDTGVGVFAAVEESLSMFKGETITQAVARLNGKLDDLMSEIR